MQDDYNIKGDCHELVGEEEPGEAVEPLANEGRVLQVSTSLQQPQCMHLLLLPDLNTGWSNSDGYCRAHTEAGHGMRLRCSEFFEAIYLSVT